MSNSTFDFNLFIKESKDVLFAPRSYFSTMKTTGGIAEPLIKAVIYGVIGGIIALLWSVLKIGGVSGGFLGSAVGIGLLFGYIVGAIIGLFVGAVIIMIISAICKGSTDFEANARVTAAIMVLLPIRAFFGFVTGFNLTAGAIVALIISAYSIYILYHGLVEALKAKPETTRIVMYVLVALLVLFMLLGLGAKRTADRLMNDFNNSDFKEMLKDAPKD